ncbi:MAG: hypothetical protein ACKOQ5_00915, partial [Solirubrobacterales bacterium]
VDVRLERLQVQDPRPAELPHQWKGIFVLALVAVVEGEDDRIRIELGDGAAELESKLASAGV